MTSLESLIRLVLESHASAYHVADTIYQRDRVIASAVRATEATFREAVKMEAQALAANAP